MVTESSKSVTVLFLNVKIGFWNYFCKSSVKYDSICILYVQGMKQIKFSHHMNFALVVVKPILSLGSNLENRTKLIRIIDRNVTVSMLKLEISSEKGSS